MNSYNRNYKILIVDSSSMIVDRLNYLLTEMNCLNCVSAAHSYNEALDKLVHNNFDVVLLDTQIPGKSGFELLSYIKTNHPVTKTIMVTNQTSNYYRDKGQRIGTDHFIDKSGEFEKLVEIIKEYSVGYQMN